MKRVWMSYHRDGNSWWADSSDAPGFTAVADSLSELRSLAREGVRLFLEEDVVVIDDETLFEIASDQFTVTKVLLRPHHVSGSFQPFANEGGGGRRSP